MEQMEGINGTPETLGWHYIKGSNQQWKEFSNSELEYKTLEKTLSEFKGERKERENNVRDPQTPLENLLGFKGIQTSQVLEA